MSTCYYRIAASVPGIALSAAAEEEKIERLALPEVDGNCLP